ncbi:MAG TPA: DNA (cytosine-5-)-methyltransferase [Ignavibacteria bacterium]|nr:DNA (cytosine-5-)-methyltransferase [Ignavibacteria bacterium]
MENKIFTTIDLFAGIGGIRLGFEKNSFITKYANDFDIYCKATYDLNFRDVKLDVKDISRIKSNDLPDFDLLLAGFPCQPFSVAGYRKGFLDTNRGNLFFEIVRILRNKRPAGFLLENVKNLYTHDNGNTYKVIKDNLNDLGYHVKTEILNSMIHGNVMQNRERIFIVGFQNKFESENFKFPLKKKLTQKFKDVIINEVDEKYYYKDSHPYFNKLNSVVKEENFYQWRRTYVRENKSGVCPTLTANMGTGGHNVPIIRDEIGVRKLTPIECLKLQGFPSNYKLPNLPDSKIYKQIGNSVTVSVISEIAKEFKRVMNLENNVYNQPIKKAS